LHYLAIPCAAAVIGVGAGIWAHHNSFDPETAATQCFAEKTRSYKLPTPEITEVADIDAMLSDAHSIANSHFAPCKRYVDAWKATANEKVIARKLMRVALVVMVEQSDNVFQQRLASGLIKVIDEAEKRDGQNGSAQNR